MKRRTFLALMGAATAYPAMAGDGSDAGAKFLSPLDAARFSKQLEKSLAAKGARVAIVFRSSRQRADLPNGIDYTHGAFFVYRDVVLPDQTVKKTYAVYNLYHGDGQSLPKHKSFLKQDFPVDFTLGSAVNDVRVLVPSPEMQRRLWYFVGTEGYEKLHQPDYTLVSNPLNAQYQNCVEFVLDVVAACVWQTTDYRQIKANLKAHFTPTNIAVDPIKRTFAPMADARLRFDDQEGPVVTATHASLESFMKKSGLLSEAYRLDRA